MGDVERSFETNGHTFQRFLLRPDGSFSILNVPDSTITQASTMPVKLWDGSKTPSYQGAKFSLQGRDVYRHCGPSAVETQALDINNVGQIVGHFFDGVKDTLEKDARGTKK